MMSVEEVPGIGFSSGNHMNVSVIRIARVDGQYS